MEVSFLIKLQAGSYAQARAEEPDLENNSLIFYILILSCHPAPGKDGLLKMAFYYLLT